MSAWTRDSADRRSVESHSRMIRGKCHTKTLCGGLCENSPDDIELNDCISSRTGVPDSKFLQAFPGIANLGLSDGLRHT